MNVISMRLLVYLVILGPNQQQLSYFPIPEWLVWEQLPLIRPGTA